MTVYPKYIDLKATGHKWSGKIPSHWDTNRVGNIFSERKEKVSDKDFPPLSVTMSGIIPQLDSVAKTAANNDRKKVCKGDFVINSRSDRRGSAGISPMDGSVSLISTVIRPDRINPRYAHYLLRSLRFQEEFYRFGSGIVADLWSTNYSSMKNIVIPLPPNAEQELIGRYLDMEFNNLRTIKEQHNLFLDALNEKKKVAVTRGVAASHTKLKESKIDWLDQIPSDWKEIKAKYLFKEMSREVRQEDEIVTVFRDGQVCLRSKRRLTGFTMAVIEHGYQGIRKGDLVLHSMDAFAGAIGVSEDDGRATPEYVVTTPYDNATNCHYFAEALRLMADRNYIFVISPSVRERAPRFRFSKFADVSLPVPPPGEQNLIAEYLLELRNLEKLSARLIDLYEKKLQRLANDIVLGKIDVRNSKKLKRHNKEVV